LRLQRPSKRETLQILAFGFAAWCGPVLYLATAPHSGNALGIIGWAFGVLDGVLVWVLRSAFEGKWLPQISKAYVAFVFGGSLTAGILPLLKLARVTEYEVWLHDGSCLPIGLNTPVSMLQFLISNMIVGLPVAFGLAALMPANRAVSVPLTGDA